MKRCTKCLVDKPHAAFSKASRSPDGLHWWCKDCWSAHYHATREQAQARSRAWREAHPGYFRRMYADKRDAYRERNRRYYETHRAELLEQMREYQKRNLAKYRTYGRAYHARKWGAPNVELVDRWQVLAVANGLCGICLTAVDPDDFHVDHIVPLSAGGDHTYANTQPAHPACNLRKGARLAA